MGFGGSAGRGGQGRKGRGFTRKDGQLLPFPWAQGAPVPAAGAGAGEAEGVAADLEARHT